MNDNAASKWSPSASAKLPLAPDKELPKNSQGEVFGEEGTNKTLPEPQDKEGSDVNPAGDGKYVPPTPYTRKL